ncbi:MAG: Na+/H+ antiporter NhaC family protein [Eubacteriales bacterium]|nr:Na+/H+ antiporter NhaC family protein [Eubacteriales bacterium]
MKKQREKKEHRQPTVFEAYFAVICMLVIIGVGNGVLGYDLKMMLVVCTGVNMLIAWRCHASWEEMQAGIVAKITSMGPCFLILIGIGFLIGCCMISGTMPLLVGWLASLISPKYCLVLSFILLSILALAIGSSFAAMGTLGVVMFSVATLQGIPAGMAAAAVICGSWFGQYISPVADIVNCAAQVNKMTTYECMKDMARPLGIATVITTIWFFVLGLMNTAGTADAMANVQAFVADVHANFNTNPILILPIVLAIVLSVMKVPTVLVLFGSGFVALIQGVVFQGYDIGQVISGAYSGFSSDAFLAGKEISPELASLVNRGGMFSMADSVIFLFCALACVGLLDVIGVFDVIQKTIFKDIKSPGKLHLVSMLAILLFGVVTADPYPPVIISNDLLKRPFEKAGYNPKRAATIALSGCLLTTLCLPWSFCAFYSGNVYGVTIGQFFPYAILFPLVPILVVVLSFLGIGNEKLEKTEA